MNRLLRSFGLLSLTCLMTSGCGLNLAPTIKEEIVIARPGRPLLVTENIKVRGTPINTTKSLTVNVGVDPATGKVDQDVGGWVFMPKEHWDIIAKKLGD